MAASLSLHPPLISSSSPKPHCHLKPCNCRPSTSLSSSPILPPFAHSNNSVFCPSPTQENPKKCTRNLRVSAASGNLLLADAQIENTQQVVSSDDGVGSTIVSALLSIAFVGLTILTIGVIYLVVTDFLQKREKDKFEKEEASNKKRSAKKRKVKARAGPRGFGQKIEEDDD